MAGQESLQERTALAGYIPDVIRSRGRKPKSRAAPNNTDKGFTMLSSEGKTYQAGDSVTLGDLVQNMAYTPEVSAKYLAGGRKYSDLQLAGDFIDWVFNKSKSFDPERDGVDCPEGSHIARIEYVERWMLLRVSFRTNNNVVVYTRVPPTVFETLRHFAEGGDVATGADGNPRHVVGMKFWDFVRVRGTVHGNRYPAIYDYSSPQARGAGPGGNVLAASGKAARGSQGNDPSLAPKERRQLQFLTKDLTKKEMDEVISSVGELQNVRGTISWELTHGKNETRQERAYEKAKLMMDAFLDGPFLSDTLKKELLQQGRDDGELKLGEPLIRMERFLVERKVWPSERVEEPKDSKTGMSIASALGL